MSESLFFLFYKNLLIIQLTQLFYHVDDFCKTISVGAAKRNTIAHTERLIGSIKTWFRNTGIRLFQGF
jgi:hypothetical protein